MKGTPRSSSEPEVPENIFTSARTMGDVVSSTNGPGGQIWKVRSRKIFLLFGFQTRRLISLRMRCQTQAKLDLAGMLIVMQDALPNALTCYLRRPL